MAANITAIIKAISDINNRYRDSTISTRMKLEALWEMGDLLAKLGVTKPHSIGWLFKEEQRDSLSARRYFEVIR